MFYQSVWIVLSNHPIYGTLIFLAVSWMIGKIQDVATTPSAKQLEKIELQLAGKLPREPEKELSLTQMLLILPISLALYPFYFVFSTALAPFVFIYEKINEFFSFIDVELLTYIKVIPEVMSEMRKKSKADKQIQTGNSALYSDKQIEEKKNKSA